MICVSYSGIQSYQNCPAAFRYKYVEDLATPTPSRQDAPALHRGLDIHQSAEDFLNGSDEGLHEALLRWGTFLENLRDNGAEAEREFCFDENWDPVEFDDREQGMIRGKLDATYRDRDKDTLHLYEFKSGRKYADHEQQLDLYCLASLLLNPEINEVLGTVLYIDGGAPIQRQRIRATVRMQQWEWDRKIRAVQPPQEYPATPNWKCKFCPYSKRKDGPCEY